ncbi:MAG: hypothetical protein AAFU56_08745, partial [Pseudomonadota bacterium]
GNGQSFLWDSLSRGATIYEEFRRAAAEGYVIEAIASGIRITNTNGTAQDVPTQYLVVDHRGAPVIEPGTTAASQLFGLQRPDFRTESDGDLPPYDLMGETRTSAFAGALNPVSTDLLPEPEASTYADVLALGSEVRLWMVDPANGNVGAGATTVVDRSANGNDMVPTGGSIVESNGFRFVRTNGASDLLRVASPNLPLDGGEIFFLADFRVAGNSSGFLALLPAGTTNPTYDFNQPDGLLFEAGAGSVVLSVVGGYLNAGSAVQIAGPPTPLGLALIEVRVVGAQFFVYADIGATGTAPTFIGVANCKVFDPTIGGDLLVGARQFNSPSPTNFGQVDFARMCVTGALTELERQLVRSILLTPEIVEPSP